MPRMCFSISAKTASSEACGSPAMHLDNVQGKFAGEFEILRAMLAEQAKAEAADEPPLPVSRERFLTQPLRAR